MGGPAGERREGSKVQREDDLGLDQAHGQCRFGWAHGVMAADGEHGDLGPVKIANQAHVAEDRRVAGMVEDRPVVDGEDESRCDARVVHTRFILHRRGVLGLDHGGRYVIQLHGAAQIHADGFSRALARNPGCKLVDGDNG